jgi:hypothetical protein
MKYDSTPKCADNPVPATSKSGPLDQDQNPGCHNEIKLPSRRRFLSAAGGLTTAALTSGTVGLTSLTGTIKTILQLKNAVFVLWRSV